MSKYGDFSDPYFPGFGPEKTPYLDFFHAVSDAAVLSVVNISSELVPVVYGALSFAWLIIIAPSIDQDKPQTKMLNQSSPSIEPCRTPPYLIMFYTL